MDLEKVSLEELVTRAFHGARSEDDKVTFDDLMVALEALLLESKFPDDLAKQILRKAGAALSDLDDKMPHELEEYQKRVWGM